MSEADKDTIELSIEVKDGNMILDNGIGNKWVFPENLSKDVAIASLVYGTILHRYDHVSSYADKFKISMEIEVMND